jgi:benzoate membrane transport protein
MRIFKQNSLKKLMDTALNAFFDAATPTLLERWRQHGMMHAMTRVSVLHDVSLSSVTAGFVAVLVGYTSSAVIVFEAARAAGANAAQTASWMWALGLGMGLSSLVLSRATRMPVLTAWSTPGAALLMTGSAGHSYAQLVGAFVATGVLILLAGLTGWFARIMDRIAVAIASALLAGVLVRFGMDAFIALKTQFVLAFAMLLAYLMARQWWPRYAVIAALAMGCAVAASKGLFGPFAWPTGFTAPVFVMPEFSLPTLIGVAVPLFVVTMASQNLPGVATLHANGYRPALSPVIATTGAFTTVLAPFGGYAFNLAAITAAICQGREAHPDPAKRYTAAMAAGVLYCLIGLFGGAVAAAFAAFPRELVMAVAGLALLGTIGNALATALQHEAQREPALITFLVTASGVNLLSIGSAFWGVVAGALALAVKALHARLAK